MNTFSHECISSGTHNLMYLSVHLKMYDLGSDLTQHKDMMYFHHCSVSEFSKAISVRENHLAREGAAHVTSEM